MGRWGLADAVAASPDVVGLMSHLASADVDPAFTEPQIARFAAIAEQHPGLTRHLANSAGILRFPASHFDAGRPGIALYGLSPFGSDPAEDGLRPGARVAELGPAGQAARAGREHRLPAPVRRRPSRPGSASCPVGYADGFRRALTGFEVLVGGERCPVVGIVSMDAFAVRLPAPVEPGTPVTLIGDGILAEELAAALGTITYEIVCGINAVAGAGACVRRSRR